MPSVEQLELFKARERRTENLQVRITPTDRQRLDELATRRGTTVSVVVRTAIDRDLEREGIHD
jgi:predicted DNA-binding protein